MNNTPQKPRLRTQPETRDYPTRVELADCFAQDAADFFTLYELAFNSKDKDFQGINSRRMKCFIQLRMALEAILKAIIASRRPESWAGRKLVSSIPRTHSIKHLIELASSGVRLSSEEKHALEACDQVKVESRYEFEARQIRNGSRYYSTVGDDAWLSIVEAFVRTETKRLRKDLSQESKLKTGKVIGEELFIRRDEFRQ